LVNSGFLGSGSIHMESYYCYEIGHSGYAGALLGDKGHWVRRLPGKLLHNIISHGVARIAEFMVSESPHVIAYGFVSPYLKNIGGNLAKFLARDFHMKSGMKYLIASFYRSIVEDAPLPISYREILLTARIMDSIFAQLNAASSQEQQSALTALHATLSD